MRGDRHIFSLPPLYFVLSPYSHPIDCTSSPPQSSPVFKIKDIATIHTGNTEGSLAGKMSTMCLHCRVVMLILSLCYLQRVLVLWLAGLERFSFECRKVIGFALSTRCDWLKRFAPPFHPIRSKTKANCDALARFSRALRQPHVITSSFDWFNVLSVSYVIGQSNYFGFGFTTLKRKPLY